MMSLTAEQQKELAHFPPALRALVELELAAGNSIVEVGHSFPAPPAGAYFKLAKKVTTRPRLSGSGLDFYNRDSSIYSGEFTDAKRFYFVLEPPNPPPPEPDMNAIREKAAGKPDALTQLANRTAGTGLAAGLERLRSKLSGSSDTSELRENPAGPAVDAGQSAGRSAPPVLQSSTPTSAAWLLCFVDARPPQEVQFSLERDLMMLMRPSLEAGKLVYRATPKINGIPYSFLLTFEAALPNTNHYSLRVEATWAQMAATHHDYFRRTSGGWFDFWTRDFQRASPAEAHSSSSDRYDRLAQEALHAESHLNTVEAVQQTIVTAMKHGASFATAHKEGGTNISWKNGRFLSSDYGESNEHKEFSTEAEFLKYLRQFYDWETSRSRYPEKAPEFEAWKLILRLLRPN